MNIKEQLKNSIIKNIDDLDYILTNSIYYYKYNRINKNDINEYINIYNELNNDDYKIDELNNNIIKIVNSKKEFKKVELMEE